MNVRTRHLVLYPTEKEQELFWQQVRKTSSCWLWLANTKHQKGQPKGVYKLRGVWVSAARCAFVWAHPKASSERVTRVCKQEMCVRPDHYSSLSIAACLESKKLQRPPARTGARAKSEPMLPIPGRNKTRHYVVPEEMLQEICKTYTPGDSVLTLARMYDVPFPKLFIALRDRHPGQTVLTQN